VPIDYGSLKIRVESNVNVPDRTSTSATSGYAAARRFRREGIKFFTIPEVAECLNVSTRTVRRWIDARRLAAHKFDGIVRIAERDLLAFLAVHREG
jgi:excisionase family DNA binding protein